MQGRAERKAKHDQEAKRAKNRRMSCLQRENEPDNLTLPKGLNDILSPNLNVRLERETRVSIR